MTRDLLDPARAIRLGELFAFTCIAALVGAVAGWTLGDLAPVLQGQGFSGRGASMAVFALLLLIPSGGIAASARRLRGRTGSPPIRAGRWVAFAAGAVALGFAFADSALS
jgi:hypothetical protein